MTTSPVVCLSSLDFLVIPQSMLLVMRGSAIPITRASPHPLPLPLPHARLRWPAFASSRSKYCFYLLLFSRQAGLIHRHGSLLAYHGGQAPYCTKYEQKHGHQHLRGQQSVPKCLAFRASSCRFDKLLSSRSVGKPLKFYYPFPLPARHSVSSSTAPSLPYTLLRAHSLHSRYFSFFRYF